MMFKLGPDHLNYYVCCYISQNNKFTTFPFAISTFISYGHLENQNDQDLTK